jgi:hypothetical protein
MMDARLVWDTWRRILRSDELVEWISRAARAEPPAGIGAAERTILDDYAGTPIATDTNIGMYRRGLTRNARNALSLAPMTRRILDASAVDSEAVMEAFVQGTGFRDYGPNMWRLAEDLVAHLSAMAEFAAPAHRDALALDRATAGLARLLGAKPPAMWPEGAVLGFAAGWPQIDSQARLSAHPAAVLVSSAHDLTSWLENPSRFDAGQALERTTCHWLVYFPSAEANVEYAELSERSARAFNALGTPRTIGELAGLGDVSSADVDRAVAALFELGVVVREDVLATDRRPE